MPPSQPAVIATPMSPPTPTACRHEHRPGTTVCLRCRHEARLAGRAHKLRVAMRVGTALLALAVVGALGTVGVRSLQERQVIGLRNGSLDVQKPAVVPVLSRQLPTTQVPAVLVSSSSAELSAAVLPSSQVTPPGAILVDEGRTDLGNGLFAVRRGTSVTVNFDVAQARTRRRDKFDRIVRATLPRIYGPIATSILDTIPTGSLVQAGTLPAQLVDTGLRFSLSEGWSLALWPETRPASDGPLVVAYRAELAR